MTKGAADNIGVIILAAGLSSRMGEENKLLLSYNGKPLVQHVIDAALDCDVREVVLVTGHEAEKFRALPQNEKITFLSNADYELGMSTSIVAGVTYLEKRGVDAVLIMLGDMPQIRADHLTLIMRSYQGNDSICVPYFQEQRGNPVLWGRKYFSDLIKLTGDKGARDLLRRHQDEMVPVLMDDLKDGNAVLKDIDAPEDLK